MRLGIYVYADTSVTFGRQVNLHSYKPGDTKTTVEVVNGKVALKKGIYGLVEAKHTLISVGSDSEIIIFEDKDPGPDAVVETARFKATFPGASMLAIANYLPDIKSFSLPSGSSSNGAASEHK